MAAGLHDRWPWRRRADGRALPDLLPRWLRLGLGALMVAMALGMLVIRGAAHDPARWHVDPLAAARTGKPNDWLVAPEGMAQARVDAAFAPVAGTPAALMARLHAVALAQPRIEVVAGAPEDLFVTYVQRSRWIGFPDYVSVRAVPVGAGAGLAIWSRSRYGESDLGVNRARVERWLALVGAAP